MKFQLLQKKNAFSWPKPKVSILLDVGQYTLHLFYTVVNTF